MRAPYRLQSRDMGKQACTAHQTKLAPARFVSVTCTARPSRRRYFSNRSTTGSAATADMSQRRGLPPSAPAHARSAHLILSACEPAVAVQAHIRKASCGLCSVVTCPIWTAPYCALRVGLAIFSHHSRVALQRARWASRPQRSQCA